MDVLQVDIPSAQKGRHARVRSGSGAKVNTLRIQHPAGNTSSADRGTPRASHGWLRRKFERLADRRRWKKSRGRYPLETNLLLSDLVSADRRFHPFTPSSVTSALLFIEPYRVHGYSCFRYSTHPSFNFASSVDLWFFFFRCVLFRENTSPKDWLLYLS